MSACNNFPTLGIDKQSMVLALWQCRVIVAHDALLCYVNYQCAFWYMRAEDRIYLWSMGVIDVVGIGKWGSWMREAIWPWRSVCMCNLILYEDCEFCVLHFVGCYHSWTAKSAKWQSRLVQMAAQIF